ncbi:class I SAM-dependent RNA methyltransferase [Nakamurella silvestris]|nr:class I SAM-dependent RNA methyltransferase [Nakamurella silvestris]
MTDPEQDQQENSRTGHPPKPKVQTSVGPVGPAGPLQVGLTVGDLVEVEIEAVAHGGHCVARHDGRVIFVRHALPGERAVVRITEVKRDSFCRGDAIDILRADQHRREAPCVHFRPGLCGGCDFQHAEPGLQRILKADVVAEQLQRLARVQLPVLVEELPGDGFGWRTRLRWAADRTGQVGPRAARSHQVVPVSPQAPCLIAAEGLTELAEGPEVAQLLRQARPPRAKAVPRRGGRPARTATELPEVALTAAGDGSRRALVVGTPVPAADHVVETVFERTFTVAVDGFWQVHPAAAPTLVGAVLDYLPEVTAGDTVWDLYAGVGLFSAFLAERVGADGTVVSVELDGPAVDRARQNLADLPQVVIRPGRVDAVLDSPEMAGAAVRAIVLDPPRTGAGRAVCESLAASAPEVIVYVACDPAALARDTATLAELGYRLAELRAFDAFPQTHHVECVARFVPAD